MYMVNNRMDKLEVNLHKVLCEYEDFEEDYAQYASKQREGNNHLNHEIPEIIEEDIELATYCCIFLPISSNSFYLISYKIGEIWNQWMKS